MIALFVTLFAFLSFSRFQMKNGATLNQSQIWLISMSAAVMSIYLNIADGKLFIWHGTDTISAALFLAVRRVAGLVAVMSVLRNIGNIALGITMFIPRIQSSKPVYAKITNRTRY